LKPLGLVKERTLGGLGSARARCAALAISPAARHCPCPTLTYSWALRNGPMGVRCGKPVPLAGRESIRKKIFSFVGKLFKINDLCHAFRARLEPNVGAG